MAYAVKETGIFPRDVSYRMQVLHLKHWLQRDGILSEDEYQTLMERVKA